MPLVKQCYEDMPKTLSERVLQLGICLGININKMGQKHLCFNKQ